LTVHAKLDELLRADTNARAELATLDEKELETIVKHRNAEARAMREP
jgi:low affinity Fe/Cu permease